MINEHNEKFERGEKSWNMKINQFGDLTDVEFKKLYLSYKTPNITFIDNFDEPVNLTSDSFDWRKEGVVLTVKDQGQCECGWAFSAVSCIFYKLVILFDQMFKNCLGIYLHSSQ